MREWRDRTSDTVAVYVRPGRSVSVGANEVFVLRKDGRLVDIVHEGRTQIRSTIGSLASWFGVGPKFDGYITHTDPVKLSYWTEEPSTEAGLSLEAFGPPLITRDGQPIVAQITVEVSVDPEKADRFLRVLGNRRLLTSGDLQDRFRDELRAKLGVELEKYSSEELRGNPALLRALYDQTRQELANSLVNFGLRLDNFFISWGLTLVQIEAIERDLREYRGVQPDRMAERSGAASGVWARQGVRRRLQPRRFGMAWLTSWPRAMRRSPLGRLIGVKSLLGVGIVAVLISGWLGTFDPWINPAGPPAVVAHWTTGHLTRDGLLKEMAQEFNKGGHRTDSGKKIIVEVYDAPSELQGRYLIERLLYGTRLDLNKITNGYVVENIPDPTIVTPSSAHWLVTVNYEVGRSVVDLDTAESIVRPVIGIVTYEEMAKCLGWPQKQIGFADIIALRNDPQGWGSYPCAKGEWGQRPLLAFTDPTTSSTGRSLHLSLYAIAAEKSPADLTIDDVNDPAVVADVQEFQSLIDHYLIGTTVLNTKIHQGPRYGHFFIMPEDNLIHLYEGTEKAYVNGIETTAPPITERMVMIYPKEGSMPRKNCACIVRADWVSEEQVEASKLWIDFIREDEQQRAFMAAGFRPGTDLDLNFPGSKISSRFGLNPEEPRIVLNPSLTRPEVAAAIDANWEQVKRPSIVTLVLDTSTSMQGLKMQQAKDGLILAIDAMAANNQVGLVSFSDTINSKIQVAPLNENRLAVADAVFGVRADGQTALYDAIKAGVEMTDAARGEPNAIRAIVVLTDGRANEGQTALDDLIQMTSRDEQPIVDFDGFEDQLFARAIDGTRVPKEEVTGSRLAIATVYPVQIFFIGIGDDADLDIGRMLAEATGAEFQGVAEKDLAALLEKISRYF